MVRDTLLAIYQSPCRVFRLADIAMLTGETRPGVLAKRMWHYVQSGALLGIRKGYYAKPGWTPEELACRLYAPTYISLDYVLQRAGVIFQYDSAITSVACWSREVEVEGHTLRYHQIKGEILVNTAGILLNQGSLNIATPERAFLDALYLDKNRQFDNVRGLRKTVVKKLLPVYRSEAVERAAREVLW
jgi:hypothetical protein